MLNQNSRQDHHNRFPPRFRDLVDRSMKKSANNIIVKSSNKEGSGNDSCKTRWERPGLLRSNQGKAQIIQVAGFHRRLASTNLFLSVLPRSPSLFCPLLFIYSSFLFRPSFSLSHRFSPLLHFLSLRPLYRFCFFSSLPHCIQSGSTKLETAALSALLRLLLSAVPVSPCLLPLVAFLFFTSALFATVLGDAVTLTESRRLALTSRGQVAVTVDIGSRFIERAVLEATVLPPVTIEFTIEKDFF